MNTFKKLQIVFLFFILHSSLFILKVSAQSQFYGISGGGNGSKGSIFNYNPRTNNLSNVVSFTGSSDAYPGLSPVGSLIRASDGNLYGMTQSGGTNGNGNIYKYNSATETYTDLVDFTGNSGEYLGSSIPGSLVQATDGNLYGMTELGGAGGYGTIFKYNPNTNIFTNLISFTGNSGAYLGAFPYGGLIQASDGNLYGMTQVGGNTGMGTVFKYNPKTGIFTNLVNFTGETGAYLGEDPTGDLTQGSDGNLYGMTATGGIWGLGTIFQYAISGNTFTNLESFEGCSGEIGQFPFGTLVQAVDGNLYGVTSSGGEGANGNIFKYNPITSSLDNVVNFTGTTGLYAGKKPLGSLILASDGNLYGMTSMGGANDYGTIFKYNPSTEAFTNLTSLTEPSGSDITGNSKGNLLEIINNNTTSPAQIGISEPISIYPNPSAGNFTVSGLTSGQQIELYNCIGQKISSITASDDATMNVDISGMASGIYLVRIQNPDGSIVAVKKIAKS
jgi:uncharacterized repeat protein (TIGR03803 family)